MNMFKPDYETEITEALKYAAIISVGGVASNKVLKYFKISFPS